MSPYPRPSCLRPSRPVAPETFGIPKLAILIAGLLVLTPGIGARGLGAQESARPGLAEQPVRLAMETLGAEAQIEVRGLDEAAATEAIRQALLEIHEVSVLLDAGNSSEGGLAELLRSRGRSAIELDPRAHELLLRGMQYCIWSANAYGPLGGEIYRLWRLRDEDGVVPHPKDLRQAVASADCAALRLETQGPTRATLAAGSVPSADGMARGYAIDRAFEVLGRHGVKNAFVEIGTVVRAMGGGPDGRGWLVAIPGMESTRNPLDEIWLQDASLALVRSPKFGGQATGARFRPVDMRTGVPPHGVVQVVAVSGEAIDTQALATTLYIVGLSSGQRLLGALDPRPSVFWLLGSGSGAPLESTYRWSELARRPRKR